METPKQKLDERMTMAYRKLQNIAASKVTGKNQTLTYQKVGAALGVTGQTIYNYVQAKNKSANGYMIDAIIEEFEKL